MLDESRIPGEYIDAMTALRDLRKASKVIFKCLTAGIEPTSEQTLAFINAILVSNGVEHIDD